MTMSADASRLGAHPKQLTSDGARVRRILIVDDEEIIRTSLTRLLERAGYECHSAADAFEARNKVGFGFFDLVLCDIQMPGDSGMDLLKQIAAERPDTAILMASVEDDPKVAREAMEIGAHGYVVKPFTPNEILINVANALMRADLERGRSFHAAELEGKLTDRSQALNQAIHSLHEHKNKDQVAWRETLDRLTRALALRDEETGRHIERVGLYCELLAEKAGLTTWEPSEMCRASMLHDVGKIGIPDAILTKPSRLTPAETKTVRRHCELGYQLLSGSKSPLLDLAASIALTHHERWDGKGYPRSLAGEEIPVEGRIAAVADVFDAMSSARVYRPPIPMDEVLKIMRRESGAHFDPRFVGLLLDSLPDFMKIRDEHPDQQRRPKSIRVLVVDDQQLFAQGMLRLLDGTEGIAVVGVAASVEEAVKMGAAEKPDVVVLDWNLPDGTGADAAQRLLADNPSTKLVVLTGLTVETVLAGAVEAGCAAVLTKNRAFEEIADAISSAHTGEVTISLSKLSSIVGRLQSPRPGLGANLTSRELDVMGRLAEGLSNEAIAEVLSLSVHTVRNHVQSIIMKMKAHSKLEAVMKGLREGIVDVPPRFSLA